MIYALISMAVLACLWFMLYRALRHQRPADSALKQRAILNPPQQLCYRRLNQLISKQHIFAQVSFDTLLTTKHAHTRYKYRNFTADFVILDDQLHVLTVIILTEGQHLKRIQLAAYKDDLLKLAGYRVLCYGQIPEIEQLRKDLLQLQVLDDLDPSPGHYALPPLRLKPLNAAKYV